MEVINCNDCGRIFNSVMGIKTCPACLKRDEAKFKLIKEYIYDNPGATIEEVSENLNVTKKTILFYLKEGRLETIGQQKVLNCENCGVAISYGKYCNDCSREMALNLKSAAKVMSNRTGKGSSSKGMYSSKKKK